MTVKARLIKDSFWLTTTEKVGCSSLRAWAFSLEHDRPPEDLHEPHRWWNHSKHTRELALNDEPTAPMAAFIRNPLDRIVSAWFNKLHNPNSPYYRPQVKSLYEWLCKLEETDLRRVPLWDEHWRPQCYFIPDAACLFRLDELNGKFAEWVAQFGLRWTDSRLNKGRQRGDFTPTRQERELTEQLYAKDFALWELMRP